VAELLEKLQSDDFNQTVKLLILGLAISEILNEIVDFKALVDKPHSSLPAIGDNMKDIFQNQKEAFLNKYQIKKEDEVLLAEVLKGTPLKLFEDEVKIHPCTAKKIRRLWERMGLKNRAQLLYVAGRIKLLPYEPECLRFPEDQ
jgi:hypothetical protein